MTVSLLSSRLQLLTPRSPTLFVRAQDEKDNNDLVMGFCAELQVTSNLFFFCSAVGGCLLRNMIRGRRAKSANSAKL